MRYRNPRIAEPTVRPREGRDFLLLLGGVAGLAVVLAAIALFALELLAAKVPFPVERHLADSVLNARSDAGKRNAGNEAVERVLTELVGRVSEAMRLPKEMALTVHYVPTSTVNAMATLGGHIFVFRGLVEKLKSEDELAAVLAHEIGHVRERHVLRAMGRSVALVGVLDMVGVKSQGLNRWVLDKGTELTVLSYSRDAERQADRAALEAVHALYGHVGGVLALLDLFGTMEAGGAEILRSHPLVAHRRQELEQAAIGAGMPVSGEPRPLSPALLAVGDKSVLSVPAVSENAPADERHKDPR